VQGVQHGTSCPRRLRSDPLPLESKSRSAAPSSTTLTQAPGTFQPAVVPTNVVIGPNTVCNLLTLRRSTLPSAKDHHIRPPNDCAANMRTHRLGKYEDTGCEVVNGQKWDIEQVSSGIQPQWTLPSSTCRFRTFIFQRRRTFRNRQ
jgi:hypothetical protein